jgi:hypothetical protein
MSRNIPVNALGSNTDYRQTISTINASHMTALIYAQIDVIAYDIFQ